MKKLLLSLMLLTALSAQAGDSRSYVFVDAQGNEVADGTTLNLNTAIEESDPVTQEMTAYLHSGLYLKHTDDDGMYARLVWTVEQIDNGVVQVCFPVNCVQKNTTETYTTQHTMLDVNVPADLQAEWIAYEYGQCKLTMQVEVGSVVRGNFLAEEDGPQITLLFNYQDPAAVTAPAMSGTQAQHYSLTGRPVSAYSKGLHIVRMADGRTVKAFSHH